MELTQKILAKCAPIFSLTPDCIGSIQLKYRNKGIESENHRLLPIIRELLSVIEEQQAALKIATDTITSEYCYHDKECGDYKWCSGKSFYKTLTATQAKMERLCTK